MISMNVSVQKTPIGMEIGVRMQVVSVDKNGMGKNVYVQQVNTLTEPCVSNVSMDKSGTQGQKNVNVKKVSVGMETSAKNSIPAQVEESTMKLFSIVFVRMDIFGMGLPVWYNLNVAVGKDGTITFINVNAQKVSIGMGLFVFNAWTGKFGITVKIDVFVNQEPSGMITSVWLFNNVKEVWSGIRIPGPANAPQQLSGMDNTVWPIPAKVGKFGMPSRSNVFVPAAQSKRMVDVYLLKKLVRMDRYGIV